MEDEELRKLIENMNERNLEERIELIKKKVRSLADLKELLTACFYGEECDKVFQLLSLEEKNILLTEIKEKIEFDVELQEWEIRLKKGEKDFSNEI